MKLLYVAAWVLIIGFLVWSGNLLLQIQSLGAQTRELHLLSMQLDSLAGAWRDLVGDEIVEFLGNQEIADRDSVAHRATDR